MENDAVRHPTAAKERNACERPSRLADESGIAVRTFSLRSLKIHSNSEFLGAIIADGIKLAR